MKTYYYKFVIKIFMSREKLKKLIFIFVSYKKKQNFINFINTNKYCKWVNLCRTLCIHSQGDRSKTLAKHLLRYNDDVDNNNKRVSRVFYTRSLFTRAT